MKQKKISKLLGLVGAAALSLGLFFCPTTTLPAQAAPGDSMIMPFSDCIEWRYIIQDGKIYKCLYNCSTREWIGEWIYVRDLP